MLLVSRGRKGGGDINAVAETDPPPVSRKITETDRQRQRDSEIETDRHSETQRQRQTKGELRETERDGGIGER